jgi:hypothetical protein
MSRKEGFKLGIEAAANRIEARASCGNSREVELLQYLAEQVRALPIPDTPAGEVDAMLVACKAFDGIGAERGSHLYDCVEAAIRAYLAASPAPVTFDDVSEDDPDVLLVARAIAEHGIGRRWDDFLPVNAHDVDHGDLIEYGRAAVAAMRAASPAPVAGDWMKEARFDLATWLYHFSAQWHSVALDPHFDPRIEGNQWPDYADQALAIIARHAQPTAPVGGEKLPPVDYSGEPTDADIKAIRDVHAGDVSRLRERGK